MNLIIILIRFEHSHIYYETLLTVPFVFRIGKGVHELGILIIVQVLPISILNTDCLCTIKFFTSSIIMFRMGMYLTIESL